MDLRRVIALVVLTAAVVGQEAADAVEPAETAEIADAAEIDDVAEPADAADTDEFADIDETADAGNATDVVDTSPTGGKILVPGVDGRPSCDGPELERAYMDPSACDKYLLCANGTLSQETCGNGLLFSGKGAVHQQCDYHWRVDCGERPFELTEDREGACPYSFGIFPSGEGCADYFIKCADGKVEPELCAEGLAYDDRNHACNWPDLLPECSIGDAEDLVGFSCPSSIPVGSASIRFGKFPRFATGECDRLVTCINYYPRLIKCTASKSVDDNSLTCVDSNLVPGCGADSK